MVGALFAFLIKEMRGEQMRDYINADSFLNPIFVERERREKKMADVVKHVHNFYELYFLIDGQIDKFVENRTHHLKPFDLIIIRPNVLHRALLCKDYRHERVVVYFDERSVNDKNILEKLAEQKGVVSLPLVAAKRVFKLINILLNETENDIYHDNYVKCVLNEMLILILRNQFSKSANYAGIKFEKIIDYVRESTGEAITLSSVAQKFFVSEAHLSRMFKKNTGFTFTQYVNYQRVIFAQRMLLKTDEPIGNIAVQSGFESLTHFGRVFKQLTGFSPREYRKHAKPDTYNK